MKIKKICVLALMIVLISSFATSCLAVTESTTTAPTISETTKVEITKDKLEEKFQEIKDYVDKNSNEDEKIENIVVEDKVIEITTDKGKYEVKYEIKDNEVVFSSETEIKQGMSYDEYIKSIESMDNCYSRSFGCG